MIAVALFSSVLSVSSPSDAPNPESAASPSASSQLLAKGGNCTVAQKPKKNSKEWFPNNADRVFGVDVDALLTSLPFRKQLEEALHSDLQLHDTLSAMESCGLSLDRTYSLSVAAGAGNRKMVRVQGNGLGSSEKLQCIERELRSRNQGKNPWSARKDGCALALDLTPADRSKLKGKEPGTIWVPNRFTFIWATGDWKQQLSKQHSQAGQKKKSKSTPAFLRKFPAGATKRQFWMAIKKPSRDLDRVWAKMSSGFWMHGDFKSGMHLKASVAPNTGDDVAPLVNQLKLELAAFGLSLKALGTPIADLEQPRVAYTEKGTVDLSLDMTKDELTRLFFKLSGMFERKSVL